MDQTQQSGAGGVRSKILPHYLEIESFLDSLSKERWKNTFHTRKEGKVPRWRDSQHEDGRGASDSSQPTASQLLF